MAYGFLHEYGRDYDGTFPPNGPHGHYLHPSRYGFCLPLVCI